MVEWQDGRFWRGLWAVAACAFVTAPAMAQNIGMVCQTGASFQLETEAGYVQTPDGNTVFMWGYALGALPFQMPGPVLCVKEGQTITIELTNHLSEPSSIVFPGQAEVTATGGSPGQWTQEAAPGGSVTYSFVAGTPGTYLYESGTQPHKQVHMGLYGVLVVRPLLGDEFAYDDPATEFSDEFLLVLHEIDPELHQAVELGEPFNPTVRHDRYWTINGRSMPDAVQDNLFPLLPSQPYGALVRVEAEDPDTNPSSSALPVLVRYANAGSVNHPFHPHGDHLQVIAQDGGLLDPPARIETFTRTIAAGQTYDLLFSWTNVENWLTCTTPPCGPGSPGGQDTGAGPLPVAIPGLQDLVFKDDVTFYSGDPHLGFVDDLPAAVTSFGECGEFYFPWHSHALDTVQNFDEGFGGMLTLVRVDPPGGCP